MANSFKNIPITKDNGRSKKSAKRFANKKVRHTPDIPSGGSFKKVFCSYEISDWSWGSYSYKELVDDLLTSFDKGYIIDIEREYYRRISK